MLKRVIRSMRCRSVCGALPRPRYPLAVPVAIVVAVAVTIAGCSSSSGGKPNGISSVPSGDPSTSASTASGPPISTSLNPPTSPNPSDLAKAQVLAFLPTYYSTLDQLSSSQTLSLNELDQVTTDNEATVEKTTLAEERVSGETQQGTTQLKVSSVTSVDLTQTGSSRPSVHVTTCIDVTNVREIDKSGKSVTLPTRPDFFIETLTVVNIAYPASDGWRVSDAPNKGAQSCDGV